VLDQKTKSKLKSSIDLLCQQAVPTTGLKADLIFNVFKNRCHEEPDFMKRLRAAFQFNILKKGAQVCSWSK
jgi:hypothetical protein